MKNLILLRVREIVFNRQIELLNFRNGFYTVIIMIGISIETLRKKKIIKYLCKGNFFLLFFYK